MTSDANHNTQSTTDTEQTQEEKKHTCRYCEKSVIPQSHDDTGLSCPECGIGISYENISHYRNIYGEIQRYIHAGTGRSTGDSA